MAIEWIDGFDHYGGTHSGNNLANARYQNMTSGASSSFSLQAGRFGGRAIQHQGASGTFDILSGLAARSTFTIGMALFRANLAVNNEVVYRVRSGTSEQFWLGITPTGQVVVGRTDLSATIIATSVATPFTGTNIWRYLELELVIDNTAGEVRVWVDGVQVINVSSVDTQGQAGSTADGIKFFGIGATGGGVSRIDDMYICTTATEHKGDCRIETLAPTADTADKDWGRSTGSDNYALVDEAQGDADTTYVTSSTVGNLDKYTMGNLSSAPAAIHAVQTVFTARKDDAATREVRSILDSSGTVANGATRNIGSAYSTYYDLYATDPNGGGAWSETRVNALLAGIETVT